VIKPALLIIDMQNDFIREGSPLRIVRAEAVIGNIADILNAFRIKRHPVIHILRIHRKDGSDVEISRRDLFRRTPFAVEGTPGSEVISELSPRSGEYILHKNRMSAFMSTDLDLLLRSLGADTLFVTGVQTPNCIRTTVFDAFALNYETYLIEDAVAAQTPEIHQSNVRDMAAIGIHIIKTDDMRSLLPACE
jgi:nicotinamidase-related amidase